MTTNDKNWQLSDNPFGERKSAPFAKSAAPQAQQVAPEHDENPDELEPRELLASRLIAAWCEANGKRIPWAKAIEISAIVTKMPEDEKQRLLSLGDESTVAAPAQTADLHNEIMNLPCKVPADYDIKQRLAYKVGHRDARHAAAELVAAPAHTADQDCTEPNRAACPRLCHDFCNAEETRKSCGKWENGATSAVTHPDDIAVDRFAAAMRAKMAASRAKGRGGWDDPAQCTIESLQTMLIEHLAKGDPVDIGNFAMMLFNRAAPVAQPGQDERAAFEAWVVQHCSPLVAKHEVLRRSKDGMSYAMFSVEENWQAWQARAALSAVAQPSNAATPPQFSERDLSVLRFALHMFASNAHLHAEAAAQDKNQKRYKNGAFESFQRDAQDAERLMQEIERPLSDAEGLSKHLARVAKAVGEREAFEKEMRGRMFIRSDFRQNELGHYKESSMQAYWEVWQARAALTAAAQPKESK